VEIKGRDGADAADGGRCETVYVAIIPSPAAATVAARHHHCVHYHYRDSLQVYTPSDRRQHLQQQQHQQQCSNFNRDNFSVSLYQKLVSH